MFTVDLMRDQSRVAVSVDDRSGSNAVKFNIKEDCTAMVTIKEIIMAYNKQWLNMYCSKILRRWLNTEDMRYIMVGISKKSSGVDEVQFWRSNLYSPTCMSRV